MKKKTQSHAPKNTSRSVKYTKKAWHQLLPARFSFISVTILGCLALILGGTYYIPSQNKSEVLAVSTGNVGSTTAVKMYGKFDLDSALNAFSETIRAKIQRSGSTTSNTISCKTGSWQSECGWTFYFYPGYKYFITPNMYAWNGNTIIKTLHPSYMKLMIYKPGGILRKSFTIYPGNGASFAYTPYKGDYIVIKYVVYQ